MSATPANPIPFRRLVLMPWRWSWVALCVTMAAAVLIAYGVSYALLAEKDYFVVVSSNFQAQINVVSNVHYPRTWLLPPMLREAVELFFAPAHQIDRLMRPHYWETYYDVILE